MKKEFVTAALALFTALPAFSQTDLSSARKAPVTEPHSSEKDQKTAKAAAACIAVITNSQVNLSHLFPDDKANPAVDKLTEIGEKAIGVVPFSTLMMKSLTDISLYLGMLKAANEAEFKKTILEYAGKSNYCIGLTKTNWPNVEMK